MTISRLHTVAALSGAMALSLTTHAGSHDDPRATQLTLRPQPHAAAPIGTHDAWQRYSERLGPRFAAANAEAEMIANPPAAGPASGSVTRGSQPSEQPPRRELNRNGMKAFLLLLLMSGESGNK